GARDTHDEAAKYEGLDPTQGYVLAAHRSRILLVANGALESSPGRTRNAFEQEVDHREDDRHEHQIEEDVVTRRERRDEACDPLRQPATRRIGEDAVKRTRDTTHRLRPVGQPALVLKDEADHFGNAECRDGEEVCP